MKPHFVEGLSSFEAQHESPYGNIISGWKKESNKVTYHCEIPPNSTAVLYLEGKDVSQIGGEKMKASESGNEIYSVNLATGKYEFVVMQ